MKPNTQLNHIIGLATEHLADISICTASKRLTVFIGGDKRKAQTDNRDEMAAVADWLSLMTKDHSMYGAEVVEGIKASATATVEADKAIQQHVDAPRFTQRGKGGIKPADQIKTGVR